jgi:hypothetical protein
LQRLIVLLIRSRGDLKKRIFYVRWYDPIVSTGASVSLADPRLAFYVFSAWVYFTPEGERRGSTRERRNYPAGSLIRGDRNRQARIRNQAYEVSLERRKTYGCIPNARVEKSGHLRVIDESGEDYLYPKEWFVTAELSQPVRRAVFQAV